MTPVIRRVIGSSFRVHISAYQAFRGTVRRDFPAGRDVMRGVVQNRGNSYATGREHLQ